MAKNETAEQDEIDAKLALEALAAKTPAATVGTAADYVTVCCKLPQGINVAVPGTDIKIKLNGFHSAYALFNHGRTSVPRAQWEAVEAYYATHPGALWLHNGMVFAESDAQSAVDHARDRQEVKGGFEPVDPAKLAQEGVNGRIQAAE